jgi:hypothetical protein
VIDEGETGYLVAADDSCALTQRLESLARDRHRLAEMAVAARRSFLARPRWRDTAATIEAYLEDVWIERRARRRRRAEAVTSVEG